MCEDNLFLVNDWLEAEAVLGFDLANSVIPELGSGMVKGSKHGFVIGSVEPTDYDGVVIHRGTGSRGVIESVEMVGSHGERFAPEGFSGLGIEAEQSDGFRVTVLTGNEKFVFPDDRGTGTRARELS
jgi:hypothetical protein